MSEFLLRVYDEPMRGVQMFKRREIRDMSELQDQLPQTKKGEMRECVREITRTIKSLGGVKYDLMLPETKYLPLILDTFEKITGIVYGRYRQENDTLIGRGVLVATSRRVLLLDKKPLFLRVDELTYEVISGVTYTKAGVAGTVVLHSGEGDIKVRTFNQKCAKLFVKAIEAGVFYHSK